MEPGNNERAVYIYALCEPDGATIRYIGSSVDPARRLCMHLAQARRWALQSARDLWLRDLLARGTQPVLLILATTTVVQAERREYELIEDYFARGCALTNTRRVDVQTRQPWSMRTNRSPRQTGPRPDAIAFGRRLRTLRQERTLSQSDLADMIGSHQFAVSRWERGVTYPYPQTMRRLCAALDVEPSALLAGD